MYISRQVYEQDFGLLTMRSDVESYKEISLWNTTTKLGSFT